MADAAQYQLEPDYKHKFKASRAKEIIGSVLKARLTGAAYHADNTSSWAREIADDIKAQLKGEGWTRYKFAVQVFVGEQRGEGLRLACRGFWDPNTDSYAHDIFQNESLFCVACALACTCIERLSWAQIIITVDHDAPNTRKSIVGFTAVR